MAPIAPYLPDQDMLTGSEDAQNSLRFALEALRDFEAPVSPLSEELTANGEERATLPPSRSNGPPPRQSLQTAFPEVGTPEWGEMNRERADLIRKEIRGELTEQERQRYETLQRQSYEALERRYPRGGEGKNLPD
jgi:hypothetical protein